MGKRRHTGRTVAGAGTIGGFGCLLIAVPLLVVLSPLILLFTLWQDYHIGTLRREFDRRWGGSGKRGVLVYSNSPSWQTYIESNWLPRLAERLVVLNWSERATWDDKHPFEALVFRRFAGDREFNPMAVIFVRRRPNASFRAWMQGIRHLDPLPMVAPYVRDVHVIRFWQAFRDFKHGKEQALRAAERELFAAVDAT